MFKKIGLLALLGFAYWLLSTLYYAGSFKTIEPHSQLTDISVYTNVAGTEDLDVDIDKGVLFISSTDRWKFVNGDVADDGIFRLNPDSDDMPVKMTTAFSGEFHPHGISFFSKNNRDYLFVVNHNQSGNFIEKFEVVGSTLNHLKSYADELMCCPNDVVAVDVNKFYVSNDHGGRTEFKRSLEDYLRIANAYVLYFDGEKFSQVYENLSYANGVNASPDGATLYVTETVSGELSVFDIDAVSGRLNLRFSKALGTGLDNVTIDAEGNLWIAAHPKLLDFAGHATGSGKLSPSQVLRLRPNGDSDFSVEEIYLDSGAQVSGSSTALHHGGSVYVGVVFENKLLHGSIP